VDGIEKLIVWLGVEGLECSTAVEKQYLDGEIVLAGDLRAARRKIIKIPPRA